MAGNFLHTAGTGGLIGTTRTVTAAGWLNTLGIGGRATSDATADTGVFSQSSFSNCMFGVAVFRHITNTFTPTAGGCLAFWWLSSIDDGSTFEDVGVTTPSATVPAIARAPDFIIPVYTGGTATTAGNRFFSPVIRLPNLKSKLVIQNMSGVAFSAHDHTLTISGIADGYT